MKRKNMIIPILFVFVSVLTGCAAFQSPEEKIHFVLEEVVTKEKVFEEQQSPLVSLESTEQEIYKEIIESNGTDQQKISQLSNQALESVRKRKEHMNKEQKSLQEARQTFLKMEEFVMELENDDVKAQALELYDLMKERYETHEELYKSYQAGLELDQDLYQLFLQTDRSVDELEDKIKAVNKAYEQVFSANEKFNALTKRYNELKREFYLETGLSKSIQS